MKEINYYELEELIPHVCKSCEFNFNGTCAGGDSAHKYGHRITEDFDTCKEWGASVEAFNIKLQEMKKGIIASCANCEFNNNGICENEETENEQIIDSICYYWELREAGAQ